MKKTIALSVACAAGVSLLTAPSAFAAYDTEFDTATQRCTLTIKDADVATLNDYFSEQPDMVRAFALLLRSQFNDPNNSLSTYPEADRDFAILDAYLADHPTDPLLILLLASGATLPDGTKVTGIEANKAGDRMKDAIEKLGYNRNADYRWFVAPPEKGKVTPPALPGPVSISLEQAQQAKSAGTESAYKALVPRNQTLQDLVDKKYGEEFNLLNAGEFLKINSEKLKAQKDALLATTQERRDAIYKILGYLPVKDAVDDCIIRSQGRDPEEARQVVGSSDDIAKLEPVGWVALALFIVFTIAGIGYGWVLQNHPEWIGARA
ncbi:MAG: hypothetical protein SPI77_07245 [Corynebacterium sp.]|nr:hypothetical protein [Corynebacterium sp.]